MASDARTVFSLNIETGADRGRQFIVPATGARLGRSSQNDFAVTDELLSRHHCRFEFRNGALWVVDLASANQTTVNGKPVTEAQIKAGDVLQVGDTVLRVAVSGPQAPAAPGATPVIDLGLRPTADAPSPARNTLRPLLWTVGAVAVLLIGATYIMTASRRSSSDAVALPPPEDRALQIGYEKIEANTNNVFRYEMTLSPDNVVSVRIDDLAQNRHVRKEKSVDPLLVAELARAVEAAGFFTLDAAYQATSLRPDELNTWEITVVIGRRTHRCRVANRAEPERFRAIRERLETFGKNELGIWAIQFSADKLIELARDALLIAQKNCDERDIQYGNLSVGIQRYREAEFYLDTVDPKPAFYPEIVSGLEQARKDLDTRYEQQRFRADRAINLQDWPAAAQELRVLCELVPDRADERHTEAMRKLLDVETRLRTRRK
jgi:pSer/pThr/pTyr-binding forkhead associated (FHA) protein